MSTTPARARRRKLSWRRRLLVAGALLLGFAFVLSALANFIGRDDLTEVSGPVREIERKTFWEDVVLYVRVEGARGRFKYEAGRPGFDDFQAAIAEGTPVKLWVETDSLDFGDPATIFGAEVNGQRLIRFDATAPLHNRETWYVLLAGPVFWFLGFWIWHRATRRLPTPEEIAAHQKQIEQLAEKNWLLFLAVYVVDTVRQWGEKIPKLGDLFTALLFFWILPLYMVFIYVTAQSHRVVVAIFCFSYWILLSALSIAALTMPSFPGAREYPELGETGSRLMNAYIVLNIVYGGAIWLWGTLTYEPETAVEEPTT